MQALESASLSLVELRRRGGFAEPCKSSKGRRKDVEHALMAVFWGFSLQARTRLTSAYALEQFFEPDAFYRTADNKIRHRNKWPRYLAGRSMPKVVLAAVELKCPGANACLSAPLWPALAARHLTKRHLEALLLRLDPGIVAIIRGPDSASRVRSAHPGFYGYRQAEALERRASLDALAAAVILLRIAHVEGESAAAYKWGRHVLRITLMLGALLKEGGIARAFLELLDERVLMLAEHDGVRPGFPYELFTELSSYFAIAAQGRVERRSSEPASRAQRLAAAQKLFDVKAGFDYFHAFNPVPVAHKAAGAAYCEQGFVAPEIWQHVWAMNMLSFGGHPDAPPLGVSSGNDLYSAREGTEAHRVIAALALAGIKLTPPATDPKTTVQTAALLHQRLDLLLQPTKRY